MTLLYNRSRSTQDHNLYKLYIGLKCQVPFAVCQVSRSSDLWFWRRRFFKRVFTIYGHGGHLGNVSRTNYRIRPNYRTVRSGFSKLLTTLICGKICIYLLRIHYKKDQKRTYLMMTMPFFLNFFTKAYVVGTHLNCIDLSVQFK